MPVRTIRRRPGAMSHIKLGDINLWGLSVIRLIAQWPVRNTGDTTGYVGMRFILDEARRGRTNPTWLRYEPRAGQGGPGLVVNRIFDTIGNPGTVIVYDGAAIQRVGAGEVKNPLLILDMPGPSSSDEALEFWNDEAPVVFDVKIEIFSLGSATGIEPSANVAEHRLGRVFKAVMNPTSMVPSGRGGNVLQIGAYGRTSLLS